MRRRSLAGLVLFLFLPVMLTGCWDRYELEELSFVLLLGIDKGETDRLAVTAVIAIPSRMEGGGDEKGGSGSKERPYLVTTVEDTTVSGALGLLGGYMDRRVSVDHIIAFFMGEDLAREGALEVIDPLVRHRRSRRPQTFLVVRGTAKEFINQIHTELEKNPQRYLESITANYRYNGLLPATGQLQHFITNTSTPAISPVTYYASLKSGSNSASASVKGENDRSDTMAGNLSRKGGPNVEFLGAAVFRGDKMVGTLTGEENRLMLMAQGRFVRGVHSIPDPVDPDKYVTLDVRRGRPVQIQADLSGPRPRITGRITLEGELFETPPGSDYTEPEMHVKLEQAFEQYLKERLDELIRKTQKWETDIFGFGYHVARHFATVPEWLEYNWPQHYPEAEVEIEVDLTMRRFGTQMSPPLQIR